MKKFFATSLIALVTVATIGCKKTLLSLFPGLDVKVPDMNISVPAIPLVPEQEVQIGSFTSHFNLDSTIRANTNNVFDINDVTSMKVKSMVATLANGNSVNNLSNFESSRILISSNANNSAAALANFQFPATETYTQAASTDNTDIISYYRGTEITYQLFGNLRKPTTQTLNLNVSTTIRVN